MSDQALPAVLPPSVMERRRGAPPAPKYGELLVEFGWRPTDRPPRESEGWFRAHGYAPDRRQVAAQEPASAG